MTCFMVLRCTPMYYIATPCERTATIDATSMESMTYMTPDKLNAFAANIEDANT